MTAELGVQESVASEKKTFLFGMIFFITYVEENTVAKIKSIYIQ